MAYTVVPGGTFDGAFHLGSDIPGLGCLFHLELDKLDTGIPVFRSVILPIGREVDTVCRDAVGLPPAFFHIDRDSGPPDHNSPA